jgi:branched-chain amino acid transport system permease protein
MGFVFVIDYIVNQASSLTGGGEGLKVPTVQIGQFTLNTDLKFYFLIMPILILLCYFTKNLLRTPFGRALIAIRDRDIAAEVSGVHLAKCKVQAFMLSAFYAGVAGAIYGPYVKLISPDYFGIRLSIDYIAIIIIGGLGTVVGTLFGSVFVTIVPELLRIFSDLTRASHPVFAERFGDLREGIFGALIIAFILFEPTGLAGIWRRVKIYFQSWPFRY